MHIHFINDLPVKINTLFCEFINSDQMFETWPYNIVLQIFTDLINQHLDCLYREFIENIPSRLLFTVCVLTTHSQSVFRWKEVLIMAKIILCSGPRLCGSAAGIQLDC